MVAGLLKHHTFQYKANLQHSNTQQIVCLDCQSDASEVANPTEYEEVGKAFHKLLHCICKSLISSMTEFLNLYQDGYIAPMCLRFLLKNRKYVSGIKELPLIL